MHTFVDKPTKIRLEARSLESGYGAKQILHGIDLEVHTGEIVAIVGHNGAGKSTLLKVLFGLLCLWNGSVVLNEECLDALPPRRLLRLGVAYVPQGGRVFGNLSVRENLLLSAVAVQAQSLGGADLEMALSVFPVLERLLARPAGVLSGGERQMLALSMGLVTRPRLMLLDEPSLGLSPSGTQAVLERLRHLRDEDRLGFLVVEQKVSQVLAIADRVYVLRNGQVSFSGAASELSDERKLSHVYL